MMIEKCLQFLMIFFFFLNIVSNLNIHQSEDLLVYLENFNDPIEKLREEHKKSF